jgi:ferric-dicitrate binding protein FerR (iron transport regulator)
MDRNLIRKYFRNECTEAELKKISDWFQTDEGQEFLEEDIDCKGQQVMNIDKPFLHPEIESERIFNRIQRNKQQDSNHQARRFGILAASIVLLLVSVLSTMLYWGDYVSLEKEVPEPVVSTYVTEANQQKIFTLADGTLIRLNERSSLAVPEELKWQQRKVQLNGEAYFEVAPDPDHPFVVETKDATVEVLGTKFNVNADSLADNVQVAVLEGKVELKSNGGRDAASALLTQNTFGLLQLSDSQITIEKANTQNYLNWINNRLVFSGETLARVSRQLERIYKVEIAFETALLKDLKLTADIEKADLPKVLTTVSNTFGIDYRMNGHIVVWTE